MEHACSEKIVCVRMVLYSIVAQFDAALRFVASTLAETYNRPAEVSTRLRTLAPGTTTAVKEVAVHLLTVAAELLLFPA